MEHIRAPVMKCSYMGLIFVPAQLLSTELESSRFWSVRKWVANDPMVIHTEVSEVSTFISPYTVKIVARAGTCHTHCGWLQHRPYGMDSYHACDKLRCLSSSKLSIFLTSWTKVMQSVILYVLYLPSTRDGLFMTLPQGARNPSSKLSALPQPSLPHPPVCHLQNATSTAPGIMRPFKWQNWREWKKFKDHKKKLK